MKMCWFWGETTGLVRYSKHTVLCFIGNQKASLSCLPWIFHSHRLILFRSKRALIINKHAILQEPMGDYGRELIIRPRRRNQESAWLAVEEFQRFRWHCISESLRAHHVIFRVIRTSCKQHISHKNNRLTSAWTLRLGFKADAYNLLSTVCCYVKRVGDFYIFIAASLLCMNQ